MPDERFSFGSVLWRVVSLVGIGAAFFLDATTPPGFSHGILYVAFILMAAASGNAQFVCLVTLLAVVATELGGVLWPPAFDAHVMWAERITASLALLITGGLAVVVLRSVNRVRAAHAGRLAAVASLEQAQRLLKVAGQSARIGGWMYEVAPARLIWSDEVCAIHEVEPGFVPTVDEGIGFYTPQWRGRIREMFEACIADGTPFDEELQIATAKGNRLWVRSIGTAIRGENGAVERVQGALQDITQKKAAEGLLISNRRSFRAFADAMPQIVWTSDPDGAVDYASRALFDYTGRENMDLPAREWLEAVHPDDVDICVEAWERALRIGGDHSIEFRLRRADGDYRWHFVRAVPVRDESGAIAKWFGTATDIHDAKQAELARAAAERHVKSVLNSIAEGVQGIGLDGRIRGDSPAGLAMLGWTEAEIVGRDAHALLHHHHADGTVYPETDCPILKTLRDGEVRQVDGETFFRKDGTSFPVDYLCAPLRDEAGAITGAVVTYRDITSRQRHERLRATEAAILQRISSGAELRDVLDEAVRGMDGLLPDAMASILLLDPDGLHLRHGASASLPEAYSALIDGLPIGPKVGSCGTAMHERRQVIVSDIETDPLWEDYRDLVRPYGLRACWSTPIANARGDILGSFAVYYRCKRAPSDAETAIVGRMVSLVAIAIERTRKDETLRASEERFRQLAENIDEVFWMTDPSKGQMLYVSPAYEKIWGRSGASLYADPGQWMAAVHEADRARVIAALPLQHSGDYDEEYRIVRPDGTVRYIRDRAFPVHDASGAVYRIVGTAKDVTEHRESQADLAERMKELTCLYRVLELTTGDQRSIAAICADIAMLLPASMKHDDVAVARLVIDGAEHRSDPWQAPVDALRSPIASGGETLGLVEIGYSQKRPESASGSSFLKEEQALLDAVAKHVGRMVSGRRMADALTQSERLRAVGELTGGIAHDFNNLLTVILGNAEILAESLVDDKRLGPLARMTSEAAERGANLTSRLLAFARRQTLDPKPTDVNRLIAGMDELLRRTLGEHIAIDIRPRAGLAPALVDPPQLESAVLNLCINARDAMCDGGMLTIEMANVDLDASYALWHDEVIAGPYVMVAVSDTGTGIAPDVLARVFEPFFTTKEVGQGSGLGLSMVYGFAKQSRGHVKIYSEPGQGTTVRLYLPQAAIDADRVTSPGDEQVVRGSERILMVEDDVLVRQHVAEQLVELGYRVIAVADGAEAIAALERSTDFDLLFTDVVMPGPLNGMRLAAAAQRIRPGLPVLFTSGYTENAIVHQGHLDAGVHLLPKPYRKRDLAAKLRVALGQAAPALAGE